MVTWRYLSLLISLGTTVISRRNWKQWLCKILGVYKGHYGLCENGEWAKNVVNLICSLFVVRLHLFNSYSRINSSVTKGNKFPEKVTLNIMLIILLVIKT